MCVRFTTTRAHNNPRATSHDMSAAFDCHLAPAPPICCDSLDPAGHSTKLCTSTNAIGSGVEHEWSPALALEHLLGIIDQSGTHQVFPALKFASSVEGITSVSKIKASEAIRKLESILLNALGQRPRVGYNSGTGEISITVPLEDDGDSEATTADVTDCGPAVQEARAFVVQTMLGLCADQNELETLWKQRLLEDPEGSVTSEPLLANQCLVWFATQTGVGIVDRQINLVNQTLRITVASAANGVKGRVDCIRCSDHRELFQYHSSYFMMTGCEVVDDRCQYSEAIRQSQHKAFTSMLLDEMWKEVSARKYFPTRELKDLANEMLGKYVHSAVDARRLAATVNPSAPLRLYLHGTAGIGKSSFTSTIAAALQSVFQTFVSPTRRVDLVKCPLNAVTPETLQAMLHVQGISDWSIERVLEQTLRRGDVAVFHLEEAPEDPDLQATLFALIEAMVESLLQKYPDCRGKLIFVAGSNYPPAAQVAAEYTALRMAPLDKDWQLIWCRDMLCRSVEVASEIPYGSVAVILAAPPVYSADMRPLEMWRQCIAFHLSDHIKKRVSPSDRQRTTATIHIAFAPHHSASERNLRVTVALGLRSLHRNVEISPAISESFNLTTQDGLFYHNERAIAPRGEVASLLAKLGIEPMHRADVTTVVGMLAAEQIAPAVFILTGSTAAQRRTAAALAEYIRLVCDSDLAEQEVSITSMEDKSAIFGEPGEVRGGLYKFIDDVTNPAEVAHNLCDGGRRFALVTATANEEGQYILREMLEGNTSRTHRHIARKDRTAFIVIVPEGCQLRPETLSRAHAVLCCENPCAFAA